MCIRDSPNVVGERFSDLISFGPEDDKALVSLEQSGLVEDLSLIHISEAHETVLDLVCRLLLEKKKRHQTKNNKKKHKKTNSHV